MTAWDKDAAYRDGVPETGADDWDMLASERAELAAARPTQAWFRTGVTTLAPVSGFMLLASLAAVVSVWSVLD